MEKIKFKSVPFGRVLITAKPVKTESGIIMENNTNKKSGISDVQTVVAVGSLVNKEIGIDVKKNDKVLLNASSKGGVPVAFNKVTGKIAGASDSEKTCDIYMLVEAREIMMVL